MNFDLSNVTSLGFIVHWTIVIGIAVRVVMRARPVPVSLAWLAVVLLVPLFGIGVYLLVGENRLGNRRARRAAELREPMIRWLKTLATEQSVDWSKRHPACRALSRHGQSMVGIPALDGNHLELIGDSEATLRRIIEDIDRAERSVHLEFYIWSDGGTADEVVDAVVRARGRGVTCRVLVDSAGSRPFLRGPNAKRLRDAGARVVEALPVGFFRVLFRRIDVRIHRKIVVIDGEIGYTGSLNLADARFFKREANVGHWVDAMVRIEGPATEALAAIFLADWLIESDETLDDLRATGDFHSVDDYGECVVHVIPSGPRNTPETIHEMLLTTIYSARRELVVTTPYFVPDEAMKTAIVSAARRGVEVTIVLPARVDSFLVRYASRAAYQEFLDAGVNLRFYQGGLLHSKTITVDRSIALVGSVNLDMRSFWLNFEITLFVFDSGFTSELLAMQHGYLENATPLDLASWRDRGRARRFVENVIRLMGPVL